MQLGAIFIIVAIMICGSTISSAYAVVGLECPIGEICATSEPTGDVQGSLSNVFFHTKNLLLALHEADMAFVTLILGLTGMTLPPIAITALSIISMLLLVGLFASFFIKEFKHLAIATVAIVLFVLLVPYAPAG